MPLRPPPSAAPPPPELDPRASRLAQALRANLRRRKASAAATPGPTEPPCDDDGADGGEGLYASGRGASGDM